MPFLVYCFILALEIFVSHSTPFLLGFSTKNRFPSPSWPLGLRLALPWAENVLDMRNLQQDKLLRFSLSISLSLSLCRRVHQDYTHSSIILELISVLITLTLALSIVFGIDFKSAIGNCFGDQFPGCVKEICVSPPLRLDVPCFGITLTLWKLYLHSDIGFELISNTLLSLTLLIVFELRI